MNEWFYEQCKVVNMITSYKFDDVLLNVYEITKLYKTRVTPKSYYITIL